MIKQFKLLKLMEEDEIGGRSGESCIKEPTPLEALKDIQQTLSFTEQDTKEDRERVYKDLDLIETALKEYEFGMEHYREILNSYNKEHKALDIIKDEFEISFDDKEQTINLQSVEHPYPHIRFSLTRIIKDKDKYDLLKEVLL